MLLIQRKYTVHATKTRLYTIIHGTNSKKNDCQTISIKKQDLKMFEIIFNKNQDPFPPDTRCLLAGSNPSRFPRLIFGTQKKSQINIRKKTLDLKSNWKYSSNKNTSRMNDWNKLKRSCFINKQATCSNWICVEEPWRVGVALRHTAWSLPLTKMGSDGWRTTDLENAKSIKKSL